MFLRARDAVMFTRSILCPLVHCCASRIQSLSLSGITAHRTHQPERSSGISCRQYACLIGLVPRRARILRRPRRLTRKHLDLPLSCLPICSLATAELLAGAGHLTLLYSFDPPCLRAWMVLRFVTIRQNATVCSGITDSL
jgi:hypothetical protein